MEKTLILTVGLPRSGKSTWAKQQGRPIVNPDSIRMAIHGHPFIRLAEPLVWAIAKVMVRALFSAGHNTVILDATNTTKARRDEWRSSEWTCCFCQLGNEEMREACIDRAIASGKDYLVDVTEEMADTWESVSPEEGECLQVM